MKRIQSVLAVLAVMLAPGTASAFFGLGVQDDWHEAREHEALRPMHYMIPAKDLSRVCKTHPAASTYGCAIRDKVTGICLIYTAANPPQWLMDHERKHCEGWDHGPTAQHVAASPAEVSGG